ncbi:hypothetical protein FACS1894161_3440 [Spirochaetia bacterium]|nr:hypothetical protein FACS1894161_3440 [Spirochaetia bacterium]
MINNIPVSDLVEREKKSFVAIVDKILAEKTADPQAETTKAKMQIDKMVYELYGLTTEEINVVEGKTL